MDGLLVSISILLVWQLLENMEMSEKLNDVKNNLKRIERKIK